MISPEKASRWEGEVGEVGVLNAEVLGRNTDFIPSNFLNYDSPNFLD